jgi:hypothetical protein
MSANDFYVRVYSGHKGKFGHEFLEIEFRPDGKVGDSTTRLYTLFIVFFLSMDLYKVYVAYVFTFCSCVMPTIQTIKTIL